MTALSRIVFLRCLTLGLMLSAVAASAAQGATVAYWQFDRTDTPVAATPVFDRSVGTSAFALTASDSVGYGGSILEAVDPVPNPDTTPGFVGTPAVNDGSVLSTGEASYRLSAAAGSSAAVNLVSNSWTFEGWFSHSTTAGTNFDVLFNTRGAEPAEGILFDLREISSTNRFSLFIDAGATSSVFQPLTPVTVGVGVWHHFALTYSSSLGTDGRFQLFLDGTSLGTHELPAGFNRAAVDSNDIGFLELLGRNVNGANSSFNGRADEWRISNTVLAPNQFLNYVPEPSSGLLLLLSLCGYRWLAPRKARALR